MTMIPRCSKPKEGKMSIQTAYESIVGANMFKPCLWYVDVRGGVVR